MFNSVISPATEKGAYKRPYKSRSQRRETDRRKHDETTDSRFLIRIAVAVGLLVALALGFAAKGLMDRESTPVQATEAPLE